jgi:hypothetical protein
MAVIEHPARRRISARLALSDPATPLLLGGGGLAISAAASADIAVWCCFGILAGHSLSGSA